MGEPIYTEYRPDGWPYCPQCEEDELWSDALYPTIETIVGCYNCNWKPPRDREEDAGE